MEEEALAFAVLTHHAHYPGAESGMENRWVEKDHHVHRCSFIWLFAPPRKKSQIFGALVLNLRDSLEQSSNESYTTLLKNMARYPLGELEALATTTR